MDVGTILEILNKGGVLGTFILIVASGARRLWVWGWLYAEVIKDRDEWKQLALTGMEAAKSAVQVAERTAK